MLAGLIILLGFTYGIWGLALLLWVCIKCGVYGPLIGRLLVAAIVASLCTALFTPVSWGTEGFGMFIPWYFGLFDRAHTFVDPIAFAVVFALSFIVNLLSGGRTKPRQATAQQMPPRRSKRL